jgi:hypothetical protein
MASSDPPPPESLAPNETHDLKPEHLRAIGLRLRGKRWSEVAATLGVSPWTVWSWRQQYPAIDAIILQQCEDALEAGRTGLAGLVPIAVRTLGRQMRKPDALGGKVRVTAAKIVLDMVKRVQEGGTGRGDIMAGLPRAKRTEGVTDDELDRALSEPIDAESEP